MRRIRSRPAVSQRAHSIVIYNCNAFSERRNQNVATQAQRRHLGQKPEKILCLLEIRFGLAIALASGLGSLTAPTPAIADTQTVCHPPDAYMSGARSHSEPAPNAFGMRWIGSQQRWWVVFIFLQRVG
jgi:hypothetical protein